LDAAAKSKLEYTKGPGARQGDFLRRQILDDGRVA
jgi:hypothetical protein